MNDAQTTYHCKEFDADIYDADWAEVLSNKGYTLTARTEVSER
jgi:hypothetical protein